MRSTIALDMALKDINTLERKLSAPLFFDRKIYTLYNDGKHNSKCNSVLQQLWR